MSPLIFWRGQDRRCCAFLVGGLAAFARVCARVRAFGFGVFAGCCDVQLPACACCCLLLAVGCWLLAVVVGCWLLVAGCWLLVAGGWLLVVGCWLLVVGLLFAGGLKTHFAKL